MPSIQDFQKSKKKNKNSKQAYIPQAEGKTMSKAKRRPGRDKEEEKNETQKMKTREKSMSAKHSHNHNKAKGEHVVHTEGKEQIHAEPHTEKHSAPHVEKNKIEINFPGSEMLRAKLPRPFEVAEKVANEWVNDGNFEGLPLGHPLAQILAAQGLKKAKAVEKKVVASGVIEKMTMQALTFGMKAQQEITNIREQVKTKFGKK